VSADGDELRQGGRTPARGHLSDFRRPLLAVEPRRPPCSRPTSSRGGLRRPTEIRQGPARPRSARSRRSAAELRSEWHARHPSRAGVARLGAAPATSVGLLGIGGGTSGRARRGSRALAGGYRARSWQSRLPQDTAVALCFEQAGCGGLRSQRGTWRPQKLAGAGCARRDPPRRRCTWWPHETAPVAAAV
jgi:hypothetical protein